MARLKSEATEFLSNLNRAPNDREKLKVALNALYRTGFFGPRTEERPKCPSKQRRAS